MFLAIIEHKIKPIFSKLPKLFGGWKNVVGVKLDELN